MLAEDDQGIITKTDTIFVQATFNEVPKVNAINGNVYSPLNSEVELFCIAKDITDRISTVSLIIGDSVETKEFNCTQTGRDTFHYILPESFSSHEQMQFYYFKAIDNHGLTKESQVDTIIYSYFLADFDLDEDIDFSDFTQFIAYWDKNPDNLSGDLLTDLSMNTPPPYLRLDPQFQPDGIIGFPDLMAMCTMYHWFNSRDGCNRIEDLENLSVSIPDTIESNKTFSIQINGLPPSFIAGMRLDSHVENRSNQSGALTHSVSQTNHLLTGYHSNRDNSFTLFTVGVDESISDQQSYSSSFIVNEPGTYTIAIDSVEIRNRCNEGIRQTVYYKKQFTAIEALPEKVAIGDVFPNPFNPTARIEIQLPEEENVSVQVFNLLGQQVTYTDEKVYKTGVIQLPIQLDGFSSGLYFVLVKVGNQRIIRKCLLLK